VSETKAITLRGRVERITFHNPENAYTVAKVAVAGQPGLMTLVGKMPGVAEGQEVEASGRLVLHAKFGQQLEVESCHLAQPGDAEGVRRYLASGLVKGVGPVMAGRIVDVLGEDAIEKIVNDPRSLTAVPGVGAKRAASIAQAVISQGMLREAMILLQGHGVGPGTVMRIHRRFGDQTLAVAQNEPHRLAAEVRGIGFATADQIARRLGMAADHPSRVAAGLLYSLRQAGDEGHVFLPYDELMPQAAGLLGLPQAALGPAFARLHQERRIVVEEAFGPRAVYLSGMLALEQSAAQSVARLSRGQGLLAPERVAKAVEWAGRSLHFEPSAGQAEALRTLLAAPLAVLTGGPGTGKTTLVRALINIAQRMGQNVALAAPTGRAARRLAEASGRPAQTLHRLLEFSPKENSFLRGADRPLEGQLIIVDEASMIDIWLGAHLLAATADGACLVLVGDADQLPPVGPGLFFRQIIDSGAARVGRLTEIFRQGRASLIVENAHRILGGRMPALPAPGQEADFYFLEEPDPERAAELVRDLVAKRLPNKYGFDPIDDIQTLAPMHKGAMGCHNLNRLLRQALNPAGQGPGVGVGDKVMQSRNNYELEVFNGDMGQVLRADDEGLAVSIDGRVVTYSLAEAAELNLAYAVTVHKSQGSEYPAVVLALGNEHFVLLNRPLLYTAVTRGKKLVVVVGSAMALRRAVEHAQPIMRHSLLGRRIKALLGADND